MSAKKKKKKKKLKKEYAKRFGMHFENLEYEKKKKKKREKSQTIQNIKLKKNRTGLVSTRARAMSHASLDPVNC